MHFVIAIPIWFLACALAWAQPEACLPFRETELSDALAARAPDVARSELRVQCDGQLLVVTVREQVRVVDVAGLHGPDAARVVALVVADLSITPLTAVVQMPLLRDRDRFSLEVFLGRGAAREETFELDAGARASRRIRALELSTRLGYWALPARKSPATGNSLRFGAFTMRAGLGFAWRTVTLSLHGVVAPYRVRGGIAHHGVLGGAGADVALWLPITRHLRAVMRAETVCFINRARFYAGEETAFTTPRVALGLTVGLGWGTT